ncbi:MAG: ribosomal protein S18-alanine N-acetyltransferase [Terriglobales bacterium]
MGAEGRVSIRAGVEVEAEALARLSAECFGAGAWHEADFGEGDGRLLLVAHRGADLVGYAVVQCAADQAELQAMAVNPAARRGGIGRDLLEAAVAAARCGGAATMFLEVRESNAGARAFYGQAGFRVCGRRERYYREPAEAALLMLLPLG